MHSPKPYFIAIFLLACLIFQPVNAQPPQDIIHGEYIIEFKNQKSIQAIENDQIPGWVSKLGRDPTFDTRLSPHNIAHLRLKNPAGSGQWENLAPLLSGHPDIKRIEPNYRLYLDKTPNDPHIKNMWFLNNIRAFDAWDIPATGDDVVVAVLDDGVQMNHEDLEENIWINPGEIPGNNIDDDRNGFADDIAGWDFGSNDNRAYPDLQSPRRLTWDTQQNKPVCQIEKGEKRYGSHGTHVAGTIAALSNNERGITGVSHKVKIMPVKVFGGDCDSTSTAAIQNAILYAALNGARIINMSLGGGGKSQITEDLMKSLSDKGILFVTSAGNSARDNDKVGHFPSSYDVASLISVAASEPNDDLSDFSNFGAANVDLAAPGRKILSTVPSGNDPNGAASTYASYSGTSMATPIVSAAAAVLWAKNPKYTNLDVKNILLNSTDPIPALKDKTLTGGRLNLLQALKNPRTGQAPKTQAVKSSPTPHSQGQNYGGIRVFD